ncbi:MAG: hypothetical protein IKC79_00195, partial [Clostridia bacterium]|nr:hypothetical protein [Clostridia bacterium]
MDDNLGMSKSRELYAYAINNRSMMKEYFITHKFLNKFVKEYCKNNGISKKDVDVQFISFGYKGLIFVMKYNNTYKTLAVANPRRNYKFGELSTEAERLKRFGGIGSGILVPELYYADDGKLGQRELIMTDYIYQARPISNLDNKFGIYIPEPEYRFEATTESQTKAMKSAIIAKLVASFDIQIQKGIAGVEVISG